MNYKKMNKTLVDFWNHALALPKEYSDEEIEKDNLDIKELAPSLKLYDAVASLKDCKKVLDYGCGNGWASIVLANLGCKNIVSVDLGENIIETVNFYSKLYGVSDNITAKVIKPCWLKRIKEASFDGLVCSNVLDVIPLETSKEILDNFARVLKPGAKAIIGFNYYISKEYAKERGIELKEDRYLILDGVLRLTCLSDSEWISIFEKDFVVEKLDHFRWPGEELEKRRLFILRRK